jgi:hypothetical protein
MVGMPMGTGVRCMVRVVPGTGVRSMVRVRKVDVNTGLDGL